MKQHELNDLIVGALPPEEVERLTQQYGTEVIASILKGDALLRSTLESIDQRTSGQALAVVSWTPEPVSYAVVMARYAGWLMVGGFVVLICALIAVLPRLANAVEPSALPNLWDPLPMTIAVVMIVAALTMFLLERRDAQ